MAQCTLGDEYCYDQFVKCKQTFDCHYKYDLRERDISLGLKIAKHNYSTVCIFLLYRAELKMSEPVYTTSSYNLASELFNAGEFGKGT